MSKMFAMCRIGQDAQINHTQGGTAVANLNLAYNYGRKENGQQPTQWIKASLWGKRAESLTPYLTKGTAIIVTLSEVHIETFQKRDGGEGVSMAGRVDDLEFVPGQQRDGQQSGGQQQRPQQQAQSDPGFDDDELDRIPF